MPRTKKCTMRRSISVQDAVFINTHMYAVYLLCSIKKTHESAFQILKNRME